MKLKKVWRDRISNEVKLAVKVQENFLPKGIWKITLCMELILVLGKFQEISSVFILIMIVFILLLQMLPVKELCRNGNGKASTLFEIMSRDQVDPDEMMFHMNNDLALTKTGGMFVTSILGEYNMRTDELHG